MNGNKTPLPPMEIQLAGEDGNAFAILGKARVIMRHAGCPKAEIDRFTAEATSGNYTHLIATVMKRFSSTEEVNMNTVKIIVYGTLLSGERNSGLLRNAIATEPCRIAGTLYDTGWGFPAFVPGGEGTVAAELVTIPAADLPSVDRLEGYPDLYIREIVAASLPSGGADSGWVYILNSLPAKAEVIPSGDWRRR